MTREAVVGKIRSSYLVSVAISSSKCLLKHSSHIRMFASASGECLLPEVATLKA